MSKDKLNVLQFEKFLKIIRLPGVWRRSGGSFLWLDIVIASFSEIDCCFIGWWKHFCITVYHLIYLIENVFDVDLSSVGGGGHLEGLLGGLNGDGHGRTLDGRSCSRRWHDGLWWSCALRTASEKENRSFKLRRLIKICTSFCLFSTVFN